VDVVSRLNKKFRATSSTKGKGNPRTDGNDEGAPDQDVEMINKPNEEDWQKEVQARL
jgi:hypothetical protein